MHISNLIPQKIAFMSFEPHSEDIIEHVESRCNKNGADCVIKQILQDSNNKPQSFLIGKLVNAKIRPPSVNDLIFSQSKYVRINDNRLEYIENNEEAAPGPKVVDSSQSSEDDASSSKDIGGDELDTASLFGLSQHSETELVRMVSADTVFQIHSIHVFVSLNVHSFIFDRRLSQNET